MPRHQRLVLLFVTCFLLLLTACIQTSSEPDIVATQIVPDPSATPQVTATVAAPPTETSSPATVAPDNAVTTLDARGVVRNGTTRSATSTAGLAVTARFITGFPDNPTTVYTQTSTTTPDGNFQFEGIPFEFGILTLNTTFDDLTQSAAFPVSTSIAPNEPFNVDFTVYERGSRADVVLRTLDITVEPDFTRERLLMTQVVEILNAGDGIVISDDEGSFAIPLPETARNAETVIPPALSLQPAVLTTILNNLDAGFRTSDIIQLDEATTDALTFRGQIPLLPGEDNVIFFVITFELPYDGDITVMQPLPHRVDDLTVFVPTDQNISVRSDQLVAVPTIQRADPPADGYPALAPLGSDSVLRFSISQSPGSTIPDSDRTSQPAPNPAENETDVVSVLTLLTGMLLIGVGISYIWYDYRRRVVQKQRQINENRTRQREQLLDAIVELDEKYETSEISEEEYYKQRNALKLDLRRYLD
jgi:hypothetical protein